ncbi:MAG: trypsin-like peptidase domain-containing protein [Chloroflexi bacterium]|nr:trypsin-like peptidase domain-containing protein [Chloroflexota bacterium]
MTSSLSSSIVAVLDPNGRVVGTGFVAGARLIISCAHVVSGAGGQPGGAVRVRFHLGGEVRPAAVAQWDAENDLAILRLSGELPASVAPLSLGKSAEATGKPFRAFGYPDVGTDGSNADGVITGPTRGKDGQELLQLKSSQLAQGFSGGPVLVNDIVIGVVTAVYHTDRTLKNFDTAWAIPIELGRQLSPELAAPEPAYWPLGHSYAVSPNFTGRIDERAALSAWLNDGPTVLVVRALGGFGKSALAWHWLLNDVDSKQWPRALWWNFYDERTFETFVAEALAHLGLEARTLGPRQQADKLLEQLTHSGTLLILDGFERALRAFAGMDAAYQGDEPSPHPGPPPSEQHRQGRESDSPPLRRAVRRGGGAGGGGRGEDCLSPIAEHFLRSAASHPNLRGRVLLTTRLRPRVLEGHDRALLQHCREIELNALSPADAVAFFEAQKVRGNRAEIMAACDPYGYHPLSLRLLAGLIVSDLRQPGDIAVARRLDVSGDQIQRQHHVLEQSFDSLIPPRRKLLSRIACFRNPMTYEAIRAIADDVTTDAAFDAHLRDLISRGLLHRNTGGSETRPYDLHPIVRRYAYDRLTDKTAAHTRLRAYFVVIEVPQKFKTLEELTPLIELYHHTVRAGQYDEARTLFQHRISQATYYQFGAYQLRIELLHALFPDGEDGPPRLKDEGAQRWTLNSLANSYSLSGQPRRAVPLFERQNAICEKQGDKKNLAIGLGNVADDQMHIGALRAAEANLRRSIALCRETEDEFWEAVGHQFLERLLAYRGEWEEAEGELATALAVFEKQQHVQMQGVTWAYRALRASLMGRVTPPSPHPFGTLRASSSTAGNGESPLPSAQDATTGTGVEAARRALELADEDARTTYPVERDYVRAHWLLGAAHRANGEYDEAERHLNESLTRCRSINAVDGEADILIDLARLRAATGEAGEAARLAGEVLTIAGRCGYALQAADAHLELAKLALRKDLLGASRNLTGLAVDHARAARQLATCDGEPYVYRVAYDEAGALLAQLGEGTE